MITTLDVTSWGVADLTGNGQLVIVGSTFYLVSNVRADNTFVLLKSVDFGYHWTTLAIHTFPVLNKTFDPAICMDDGTILHIIGTQASADEPDNFDLVHFVWDTSNDSDSPPQSLASVSLLRSDRVPADYDIISMGSGIMGVAASAVNAYVSLSPVDQYLGNNLLYLVVASDGSSVVDQVVDSSPFRSGNTFGAVSLYSPSSGHIELYYNSHPKVVLFADIKVGLFVANRISGTWSVYNSPSTFSTQIESFACRYIDDTLTVVGFGTDRLISTGYFTYRPHHGLSGHLLLGATIDNADWSFTSILGTETTSLVQPVLSLSGSTYKIGYLVRDLTDGSLSGTFRIADVELLMAGSPPEVSGINLADLPSKFNTLNFTWLRGTVDSIDPVSEWLVIGEREVSLSPPVITPIFVSGFNVPPIAILEPSTLTAYRGISYTLDASNSTDADLDTIQFTWTLEGVGSPPSDVSQISLVPSADGRHAILTVPNSIGPAQLDFDVVVSCIDLDIHGVPIHTPATGAAIAACAVTVPLNTSPVVSFPPLVYGGSPPEWSMDAPRNARITIVPIVASGSPPDPTDTLTYLWQQVSGTTVRILSNPVLPTLVFQTNGVDIFGETLVFTLTVNDQVNAPVVETVAVNVATYFPGLNDSPPDFTGIDTSALNRSFWNGNISDRNDPGDNDSPPAYPRWGTLTPSFGRLDLLQFKHSITQGGDNRYLYVSPYSILLKGDVISDPTLMMYRLLPPMEDTLPPGHTTWVDAVQTEYDHTIALGADMRLYQYATILLMNSDDPDAIIDLTSLTTLTFTKLFCTYSYANRRVLALSGPDGLVLLQIDNSKFSVESFMEITEQSKLLYGANHVLWVRMADVESIGTGLVLIGTVDSNGATYETCISLQLRSIIGTWDKSLLRNKVVTTGEFVFAAPDTYAGHLQPPVMVSPVINGTEVTLVWTQERPDLVTSYGIEFSFDGSSWSYLTNIGSGEVFVYQFQATAGRDYQFRMHSVNADGPSADSNIVSIST